jgi:NDP-sugar pyrophosphorylase family protein
LIDSYVRQAVILNGGQSKRMRPYTDDRPKGMVVVADRMIVEWQLGLLFAQGITHVVISAGYLAEKFVDARSSLAGLFPGMSLEVVVESTPLGRGGGLRYAGSALPYAEPWIAMNGDVLSDVSLDQLARHHCSVGGLAGTLCLAPYVSTWGVVSLDASASVVTGFIQSPTLPYWINAGIYLFEHEFLEMLPEAGDHEDGLFPALASSGRLGAFLLERNYWRGVDNEKDLGEAEADVARGALASTFGRPADEQHG